MSGTEAEKLIDTEEEEMEDTEEEEMEDNEEERTEGTEEAELAFMRGGTAGLMELANKKLDEWKKTEVNIAIVGQSGSGKSSFINVVRDIDDENDPFYASTGVVETTSEPASFEFPQNSLIRIWDLPGAGTDRFKASEYAKEMHFIKYDAFVILSCDRFTEIDKNISQEIGRNEKPFFFARTKMDNVMRDEKKKKKKQFDKDKTREEIISNIQKQLEGVSRDKIFLISNLPQDDEDLMKYFPDNDNNQLKVTIVENLPDIQKKAIVFSIEAGSKKIIKMKAEEIARRFKWLAIVSAGSGAIPVPGASAAIDLGIFISEAIFQRKQMGIDDKSITERALKVGSSKDKVLALMKERFKKVKKDKNSAIRISLLKVMYTGSFAPSLSMAGGLGAQLAVSDAASTATSAAIPVLGSLISAAISGGMSYFFLKQMLKVHCEIAAKLIKVFAQISADMER